MSIQPVINGWICGLVQDGAVSERAWPVFHSTCEASHHMSFGKQFGNDISNLRFVGRLEAERFDALPDLIVPITGPEIDVFQTLEQTLRISARLLCLCGKCPTNCQPAIIHRRMYEEVVHLIELMNMLIELDIGEHTACHSNGTNLGFPQPETNECDADLFQEELNACGQIRFIKISRK